MAAKISLHNLVDLALCDPEVGAVNFNHLRTLLLAILKLTNTNDSFVERKTDQNNGNELIIASENVDEKTDNKESISLENKDSSLLLVNDNIALEKRVLQLETLISSNYTFPSNDVILNRDNEEEAKNNSFTTGDGSEEVDQTQLRTVWQNKKCLRRLEGVEEAIDKLFSLINDLLSKNKVNSSPQEEDSSSKEENEAIQNQLAEMKNRLDEYIRKSNQEKEEDKAKDKMMNDELLKNVDSLRELLGQNGSNIKSNTNLIETAQTQLTDFKNVEDKKFENVSTQILSLNESMDNMMKSLDGKMDKGRLPLEPKSDSSDLLGIYCDINQLNKSVEDLQEKILNKTTDGNVDDNEKFDIFEQEFKNYVEKTNGELNTLENELFSLRQGIDNISDGKLAEIMKSLESLTPITEIQEETNQMKTTIEDILKQLEQNQKKMNTNEAMLNSISQTQYTQPVDLDTSVLAAIQHLAQENRQQITGIHENIKMLQKLQMPIVSATPKDDNNESVEMVEVLQNHLLTLQEEQSKLSGHMSNMFDDYKTEFQRKQLHIDALYDYIEKLQKEKANREDIESFEMNIKDHKQALDNRVNLTTFDERYYRLEVALQQALSRLDQYVEEENSLKNELLKLSEDMSSKMDSDAGKQLKKFLDERLKAIQTARTNLPSGQEIRENAAGIRRPMPIHYNCLSCDRSIDVTQKGISPSVPYNMPSRSPLVSSRSEKRLSMSSYNTLAAHRPCGGSHTSVNVNSLRMMKVNPLQSSAEYSTVMTKPNSANDIPPTVADGVVGRDGQIYRGRLPTMDLAAFEQNKRSTSRYKSRVIHSAKASSRSSDSTRAVERPYSAVLDEEKVDKEKPFYLPMINDTNGDHQP